MTTENDIRRIFKKRPEVQDIVESAIPAVFGKYFHRLRPADTPQRDTSERHGSSAAKMAYRGGGRDADRGPQKALGRNIEKVANEIDKEVKPLLTKLPTKEVPHLYNLACLSFMSHLLGWPPPGMDNDDAYWSDPRGMRILKGKHARRNADYGLELYAHFFNRRLLDSHIYPRRELLERLCGLYSHIDSRYEQWAATDEPIFIFGETGAGKELAAKALHYLSPRCKGPFIPVNMGGLHENVLLSELFGHKKGSYSGAITDKKGAFELADKGTLFLDEVGEMPVQAQVALLRALDGKKIQRLGEAGYERPVDVRIIAATNKNLTEAISRRRFREDLFYRLNVLPIRLKSIREKTVDERVRMINWTMLDIIADVGVVNLIQLALSYARAEEGKQRFDAIAPKAYEALIRYPFFGNFRELRSILKQAFIKSKDYVKYEDLPDEVRNYGIISDPGLPTDDWSDLSYDKLREKLDEVRRRKLEDGLKKANGIASKLAELLHINKHQLYRDLDYLNIKRARRPR